MSITLEQAKLLTQRTILHYSGKLNVDGSPQRWRVNGKVKTWKTRPNEVKVPLKHGMYKFGYLTEKNMAKFSIA